MLTASGWSSWRSQQLVELVEYVSPAATETVQPRPCDDPDGATLELIQLVPSQPGKLGEHS
jgi:hypothetical protein